MTQGYTGDQRKPPDLSVVVGVGDRGRGSGSGKGRTTVVIRVGSFGGEDCVCY